MPRTLVDSSAWIEFFRPSGNVSYRDHISRLIDDNEVVICGVILAELLRGTRSDKEYRELEERLSTLSYLETKESLWKEIGKTSHLLLRKGLQVPITDLLIATIALENNLPLLHRDKHFKLIAKQNDLKLIDY